MKRAAVLGVVACLCAACGSQSSSPATPKRATFVRQVDNQWFPLTPGTVYVYRGRKDGERGRDVVTVTGKTKLIQGVHCTVVDDRLYVGGHLAERTADWYAQDRAGNVWYFGEDTAELDESGKVTSTEGSWHYGIDGAQAGVYMEAQPEAGRLFRQEYYKGQAEDQFKTTSLTASI